MSTSVVIVAVALASAVEMVEAFTILLAVATTKGWKTSISAAATALLVLAVIVAILGPALLHVLPIDTLRTIVGVVTLIFGLQWVRKAILRSSGLKARHDEDAIFEREVKEMSQTQNRGKVVDSVGFAVAFKGMFLEGLEVVIIVLTLGTTSGHLLVSSVTAVLTAVIVFGVGAALSRQLSSVPENKMKMAVGVMLISFGTFWSGEGLHVHWPLSDLSIVGLIALYAAVSYLLVQYLKSAQVTEANRRSSAS
jgi:uncharacterized membrane protein